MENAENFRIVFVTTDNYENALQISRILISGKQAACCSIINNITSVFEWDNTIQERSEFLIIIKTSESKFDVLEKQIIQIHNDEVPEIISIEISDISKPYLSWLRKALGE